MIDIESIIKIGLGFGAGVGAMAWSLTNDTLRQWIISKFDEEKQKLEDRRALKKEIIRLCTEAEESNFNLETDERHLYYKAKLVKLEDEKLGNKVMEFFADWVGNTKNPNLLTPLYKYAGTNKKFKTVTKPIDDIKKECDELIKEMHKWK